MSIDPALRDHQAWLGYLQPDGLVVSPAALVDLQVILPVDAREEQQRFLEYITAGTIGTSDPVPVIADLPGFLQGFLGWPANLLYGLDPARPLPETLSVPLREFGEILEPTAALADAKPRDPDRDGAPSWLLLIQSLPPGTDLDANLTVDARGWSASPARRFERLLRETQVPIGLLANGTQLRLMYAPRGENAGSLTFPVAAMIEIAGRLILGACHMLLKRSRLLAGPAHERLPAVLAKSRDYQSLVSTRLSGQVLEALYDLLRGFQAADERTHGELLKEVLAHDPDSVYAGLLNVLLRLVFLLYAEDRGLMPGSPLYVQHYSVHGLFEKLRSDAQNYPDTMDHRYGAWPRLLALFRALHGGCRHPQLQMPARRGYLFDPERFPFLEGQTASIPLVADGVIWRVLDKLLMLGGERLSYRTLDVEQIGSVYETIMGFRLEVAQGPTIALKPPKKHGAPPAVNLAALLAEQPANRAKWLNDTADQKLDAKTAKALREAANLDDLLAALERRIHRGATPSVVAKGAMVLQPSDERRRSGSHYTPRTLTEPIVQRTLEPVLAQLGADSDRGPTPDQILNLKVCDLAVGSGAFLVATCRALGDALVRAWHAHDLVPPVPPDEDEVLLARRLVAQRCLYGVDKNPMAADLAKLSLWLATLARDHPFTFLDHCIRAGDSLVGLTRRQIEDCHWKPERNPTFGQEIIGQRLKAATAVRREIMEAGDDLSPLLKAQKLAVADGSLELVRLVGDLVIAAFFSADKDKARELKRDALRAELTHKLKGGDLMDLPEAPALALRSGEQPLVPFHWEIEFPEVFQRGSKGFDAIVGNPPFAGKNNLIGGNRDGYLDWLKTLHPQSHGNADLVAHFFRRAFDLLRPDGCFGLIATNTIGQGDTRSTGLRWIRTHGGSLYWARKRYKWPGEAAVVVSVINGMRGAWTGPYELDGRPVPTITAYLFHAGNNENPKPLLSNRAKCFVGNVVLGIGFTFDDGDKTGKANTIADMKRLIAKDGKNSQRIFPYMNGEEANCLPTPVARRYVINFGEMSEEEAWRWPDLMSIVEQKVKPTRLTQSSIVNPARWWMFARSAADLYKEVSSLDRVIVRAITSTNFFTFTILPTGMVYDQTLIVVAFRDYSVFSILVSRVHESWALFTGGTMKDDPRYNVEDCFRPFPFPAEFLNSSTLEQVGLGYFAARADLMVRNNEGLTKTYNRFHDPDEHSPDILKLRELHAAMDRAVLDAYGWTDLPTDCQFLLDWEDEDDEDTGRRRKKPWRLRWPDEVRDEVLARLLALNTERAAEEQRAGANDVKPSRKSATGRGRLAPGNNLELGLSED